MVRMVQTSKDPRAQLLLHGFERVQGGHPVSRRLQADGLQWLIKQPKPCLAEGHRVARLAFARHEAAREWTRVLFSDECFIVLFRQESKG